MSDFLKFEKLNYGFSSKPCDYQVVKVVVDPVKMIADWGLAYARDLERRNPLKYRAAKCDVTIDSEVKTIALTEEVVTKYMTQLIIYRIKDVNNELKGIYQQLKRLGVPAWIQFAISQIGIAHDWERGLEFVPVLSGAKDEYSIDTMLKISSVLRSFEPDGKPFFVNAWPKTKEGDKDVMSYAIIDGFVSGNDVDAHPLKTYIAGFLGMKLKEELTYKMLYRINYDEVTQLRTMLMTDDTILE